jgi:hypothetical protein
MVIESRAPHKLSGALPEAALAAGVRVRSFTSPDDNMQAVFEYLTAHGRVAGAGAPR